MWFEILPSFGIIVTVLAIPSFTLPGIHKLLLGNPFRRGLDEPFDRKMYRRDYRLTGNAYKMAGLEAIPDECEGEDKKKKKKGSDKCPPPQKTVQTPEQEANKEKTKKIENFVKENSDPENIPKKCELKEENDKNEGSQKTEEKEINVDRERKVEDQQIADK